MEFLNRWVGRRGEGYVVVQLVLFAAIAGGPWLGGDRTFGVAVSSPWVKGFAGLLIGVGSLGSVLALTALGPSLSVLPHPKDDAHLVQTGAYAYVRHPIYAAVLLLATGWTLWWASAMSGLASGLLLLLFDLKARREERLLSEKFSDYSAYQCRVKRLIPWIY